METVQIREIVPRYLGKRKAPISLKDAAQAAQFVRNLISGDPQENFIVLHLDGAHQPIGYSKISRGIANACNVHAREVFQAAILAGACAIIVSHNHPSGAVIPSDADQRVTTDLRAAGKLLGIPVLDHIIVADTDHYSFADSITMW